MDRNNYRSRWLCPLRRGSAAARWLGLRVLIPPGTCLSVVRGVCCQVGVFKMGRSLAQRSPTESLCLCVCVCVSLRVIRCNNNSLHLQGVGRKKPE